MGDWDRKGCWGDAGEILVVCLVMGDPPNTLLYPMGEGRLVLGELRANTPGLVASTLSP